MAGNLTVGNLTCTTVNNEAFAQIGVGQTWQDVTGIRVLGTTYTNSTGKPISISIQSTTAAGNSTIVAIGGVSSVGSAGSVTAGMTIALIFIIPNGITYSASGGTLYRWMELR